MNKMVEVQGGNSAPSSTILTCTTHVHVHHTGPARAALPVVFRGVCLRRLWQQVAPLPSLPHLAQQAQLHGQNAPVAVPQLLRLLRVACFCGSGQLSTPTSSPPTGIPATASQLLGLAASKVAHVTAPDHPGPTCRSSTSPKRYAPTFAPNCSTATSALRWTSRWSRPLPRWRRRHCSHRPRGASHHRWASSP